VETLIERSFLDFFKAHIEKYEGYKTYPIGFIGSIAFIYRDILRAIARKEGITISRILPSPIEGLVDYHTI
jgi:hypothetical protein